MLSPRSPVSGKKVCILAGRGAIQATDQLERVAEKLGAPIVKALLGKGCVPDDPGKARGVQIELGPIKIGLCFPVEAGLVGDSRRTLEALLPLLERKQDRTFLTKA